MKPSWARRLGGAVAVAMVALSLLPAPGAAAKKPSPPPSSDCTFSTATGQTTCVTVAAEVFDHHETPTLPDVACTDANGDASTQTQSRTDDVYRTDTTTTVYQGRNQKPSTLVSSTTTSSYRTVTGTTVLGPCADVTAPDTRITGAPSSSSSTSATFLFTSDEAGSSFACSLDDESFTVCTSPAGYSGLGVGSHTFRVRATDGAGNVDPDPAAWSWQVLAPPVVTITQAPAATTNSPSATFAFSSTQPGSFQCRLDDAPFAACTSPRSYSSLEAGSHTFAVKVTNANGTSTASHTWAVEADLPTCGAEVTSFSQLADGSFEVLGTGLDCLQQIGHARSPEQHPCQGGGAFFNNPAFGNGSAWVTSWTGTRIVFEDSVTAGQWSICLSLVGEFNGLQFPDVRSFDHPDFIAGPDPFNVSASGTTGDGLHFTAPVDGTSPALPAPFAGATLVADLSHDPVTGFGCVPARGTWRYETNEGTLLHFAPYSSVYGSYCVSTGSSSYSIYSKVVPTEGDLLTSTSSGLSFRISIDTSSGTFRTLHYGSLRYVVR